MPIFFRENIEVGGDHLVTKSETCQPHFSHFLLVKLEHDYHNQPLARFVLDHFLCPITEQQFPPFISTANKREPPENVSLCVHVSLSFSYAAAFWLRSQWKEQTQVYGPVLVSASWNDRHGGRGKNLTFLKSSFTTSTFLEAKHVQRNCFFLGFPGTKWILEWLRGWGVQDKSMI